VNGTLLWFLPFSLQGLAMALDEFGYHRNRVVPRWEWLGHALDTAAFLACLACPLLLSPTGPHLWLFGGLAAASCLLITKDEFIHQRLCTAGEHWLHAVLFVLHPLVLITTGFLWLQTGSSALVSFPMPPRSLGSGMLSLQVLLVAGFLVFQLTHRPGIEPLDEGPAEINNAIYDGLGERWYSAADDPVALLRAESRLRTAWVLAELRAETGSRSLAILDVACGGGFLSNPLATEGHTVTGIDLSPDSLSVAGNHDITESVTYLSMDARQLSFADGVFDVVCMMDFLEHLPEQEEVIREAARVLRPGGRFFFHTFNRTPLSWLVAIKGVAWFVRNTPRHLHVYDLFLKPSELVAICAREGLEVEVVRGVRPRVFTWAFFRMLVTGRVSDRFQFVFTASHQVGYCGWARK